MKKIITIVSGLLLPLSALAGPPPIPVIPMFTKNSFATWLYNWTVWFEGIVFIVCILAALYAAFLFITAGGDDKKITQGKSILFWAVIGIAVGLFAFGITNFVASLLS